MMAAVLGESGASRVLLYSALKGRRAGVGVEVRIDYARLHHRIPYGLYNSCRVPNHDESFSVESPPMMRRAKIVVEDMRVTWAVACAKLEGKIHDGRCCHCRKDNLTWIIAVALIEILRAELWGEQNQAPRRPHLQGSPLKIHRRCRSDGRRGGRIHDGLCSS